jgi:hypothetical protein
VTGIAGLLEPYPRVNAMAAGEVALGPVARFLGILATTTTRWEEAGEHFEDAMAMNAKIGARPGLAHTQDDYARMLLVRDQGGDKERALELLGDAVSSYRELGMERWARAAALAPVSPRPQRRRHTEGPVQVAGPSCDRGDRM